MERPGGGWKCYAPWLAILAVAVIVGAWFLACRGDSGGGSVLDTLVIPQDTPPGSFVITVNLQQAQRRAGGKEPYPVTPADVIRGPADVVVAARIDRRAPITLALTLSAESTTPWGIQPDRVYLYDARGEAILFPTTEQRPGDAPGVILHGRVRNDHDLRAVTLVLPGRQVP